MHQCGLILCPESWSILLGPLNIEFTQPVDLKKIIQKNPKVKEGGKFTPSDCKVLQKVAIIIPFRNREHHLKYWLKYLHPILQRQQLDYTVYIINQYGDQTFNRGKLLNTGYKEALKERDYDCFIFSDVDVVPMDDRKIYRCYDQPRHLGAYSDKHDFKVFYSTHFGGVNALSKEQFSKVNGFSNIYWGWGSEDDDIYKRIISKGMKVIRDDSSIGKCRMIPHERDKNNEENPKRRKLFHQARTRLDTDGLSSLKYKVIEIQKTPLYTNITVDIGSPPK
ncbi:beta-1,4-galactosyltransferase 1-like [Latimeria chalumnae]|uniref:beta-1,4-galactosyltransferase 1-like n=1 Tax=Latimeria chalumnae TaxID=7897 RepID=UPI00313E1A7E